MRVIGKEGRKRPMAEKQWNGPSSREGCNSERSYVLGLSFKLRHLISPSQWGKQAVRGARKSGSEQSLVGPERSIVLSHFSHVWLFVTPWTVTCQASLSMGFSRQEYWSGLPFPSPRDLPNPGIEPVCLMSPALAGRFFTTRHLLGSPEI